MAAIAAAVGLLPFAAGPAAATTRSQPVPPRPAVTRGAGPATPPQVACPASHHPGSAPSTPIEGAPCRVLSLGTVPGGTTAPLPPAAPAPGGARVHRSFLGGIAGSVLGTLLSPITAGAGALVGVGLGAIVSWVLKGARAALTETARVVAQTTAPHLESTWFSSTYWRVAALGALLTVPFLCAAAAQAILRSDLALLLRAAFAYLPLALIAVSLAAPVAMLLLSATDEMCALVGRLGSGGGARFLQQTAIVTGGLSGAMGSGFLAVAAAVFLIGCALALALELLVREAAVYVVVLMLPLAFAGFVWPARRVWAVRMVELLVALILSKFVIVAVLALAGAAWGGPGGSGITRMLTAMALMLLATFAPWALLRILPFMEIAAGAAGSLRAHVPHVISGPQMLMGAVGGGGADALPAALRRHAEEAGQPADPRLLSAFADAAHPIAEPRRTPPQENHAVTGDATVPAGTGGPAAAAGPGGASGPAAAAGPGGAGEAAATVAGGTVAVPAPGAAEPVAAPDGGWRPDSAPDRRSLGPVLDAPDGAWPPMVLGPGGWRGPTEYIQPDAAPPAQGEPQDGA